MNHRPLLVIMSRILEYPNDDFFEERLIIEKFVNEQIHTETHRKEILERIEPLYLKWDKRISKNFMWKHLIIRKKRVFI